jgi:hypothetical protein
MNAWRFTAAASLCVLLLTGGPTFANANHQGHGKGHEKHDEGDRDDHDAYRYDRHQQEIRGWLHPIAHMFW